MTEETTNAVDSSIPVTSLDNFVFMLSAWHEKKVKVLEHMLTIPEGSEMQVDGRDPVILSGDMMVGLQAGISLSLMELGILPFAIETVAEEAPQAG